MCDKNICFLYVTINNPEHHISMNVNVDKKKLYCYERLTSINYELGFMEDSNYIIDKKINSIIIKPRCAYFNNNHDLSLKKGIDPEKVLIKFINQLKKINIIICNNARFTINSVLAEAVRYNIKIDFSKFLIIDIDNNEISNVTLLKQEFFDKILKT